MIVYCLLSDSEEYITHILHHCCFLLLRSFVATLALQNNTGLENAIAYTQDVQHFLKNYPATEYPAAQDLEKVAEITNKVVRTKLQHLHCDSVSFFFFFAHD